MELKRLFLIALLFVFGQIYAYDFSESINGITIYYNITSATNPYTVEVTSAPGITYSGNLSIPYLASNKGLTYLVTSIAKGAFSGCSRLYSISFSSPSSVTTIGNFAFSGCTQLTSIPIPSSVTSIGDGAFDSCTKLISISIPSSVTTIGNAAFQECTKLTNINVDSSNKYYSSVDGVLFTFNKNTLIRYPLGKTGSYNIPSSVTSIGNAAFLGCTNLTSISIPSALTSIGNAAFLGCSQLTSIPIPSSVTSIGDGAFYGCSYLKSITIPSSVTSIGGTTFYHCGQLTSISFSSPSSVTSIGNTAFSGCSYLTSITIPSSVTSIGDGAFMGCGALQTISFSSPSCLTSINVDAFKDCARLISISIPSTVTTIGNTAFSGCSYLTSITIPSSVTSIGDRIFTNCFKLSSIHASNPIPLVLNSSFFSEIPVSITECKLYVPKGSTLLYAQSPVWSLFKYIIEENVLTAVPIISESEVIIHITGNMAILSGIELGTMIQVYSIDGKNIYTSKANSDKIEIPLYMKGIYIVKIGHESTKVVR